MSQWKWCATDGNGKVIKGWYQDSNGIWYHLNEDNGTMDTGWFHDRDGRWYYLADNGAMQTGWIQSKKSNKWYYLNPNSDGYMGAMFTEGTYAINEKEYSFDSEGAWIENINLLSDKGADFIGSWEGFWSKADYDPCYPGVEKYITIGYGTTMEARPDVFTDGINTKCTIEQAREWLEEEAQSCAKTIKSDLDIRGVSLSQNELDALISFAYNCGAGALLGSTLYRNICDNIKDGDTITSNFQAWSKANGATVQGLYKRRTSEAVLFLNADYTGNV
ncbi:lysozyme [Clostridium saccharobutylicum]|uniref:Lysozyme n=1 Tax=Clostridium saccharobutylicum DSM 13864 TaxID=1345695 RepID=U5MWE4_CLOSA|nr:lysozyme [Clostridium saccharobutylicum]AGX43936.1 lysozyme [Clostridium saccharobutylicum DSM 13864]AQR91234.1 putative cell wall binding repeat protein [Clostridium saccharobutylicum]AQS01138.1 putative cell wall binding repeat protein [Clostridium saccharobutylicum]AQS15121.1 putative cell wall binding repeat protein [Clostridium saccharobutylicum]MBA2905247.1 lysozyme [Clostridium saccharobutylicum]